MASSIKAFWWGFKGSRFLAHKVFSFGFCCWKVSLELLMSKRSLCKRWLSENVLGVRGAWCNRFLVCEKVLRKCVEAANAKSLWKLFDSEIFRTMCMPVPVYVWDSKKYWRYRFVIRFARPCHVETLFVSPTPCICAWCTPHQAIWGAKMPTAESEKSAKDECGVDGWEDGRMGCDTQSLGNRTCKFLTSFSIFPWLRNSFWCVCGT